jgi:hypothetical protein
MSRVLFALPLLACGMKVNINGKTRTLGGAQPQQQAQSAAPAATPRATQAAVANATPAAATFAAATIAVTAPLTSTPTIADVNGVALDASFRKTIGGDSPDCGSVTTSQPIAVIDVKQPAANMNIAVHGAQNDGFVVKLGARYWSTCTQTVSTVPTMGPPKEGWQPGRYEVYPVTRYSPANKQYKLEVSVFDPKNPAAWSDKVKPVTIEHKLAKPLFVEVSLRADRQLRREGLSGSRCHKATFAFEPDIKLDITRPIPGLVIRPLPTRNPVTLRREHKDKDRDSRYCVTEARAQRGPSWRPDSEIRFGDQDEGTYGISIGLPPGATEDKVTLMIFDASTAFDPLTLRTLTGPLDLDHRELAWHFPQLATDDLRIDNYAHAELAAKVFAAAPSEIFVYPKLDLDKDIAHGPTDVYPKKNEPLLVIEAGEQRTHVLAQDGMHYDVKSTHLLLTPDGAVAPLAAARLLGKQTQSVEPLLPPTEKKLIAAGDAMRKQHDDCIDRVAAPYERQLPTIVRPSNVDVVYIETPRTRAIRDAMDRAIDKKCGTRAAYDKKLDAHRAKELAAVEKARVALFGTAKRTW